MKFFYTVCLMAVFVPAFAQHVSNHICPNRCNADRTLSLGECNQPAARTLCEVKECDNGFSCSLPENTFLIPNIQLPLLEMVVEYTWSPQQRDLDTSTRFLEANVGAFCNNPASYVEFGGDNTSNGGSEVVVIDVEQARQDGLWDATTSITSNAQWFRSENQGSAQMKVSLRRKSDGGVAGGATLSTRIQPGVGSGCSDDNVAEVKVIRGSLHTRVTLERA
eukprot:gb/GEZJ01006103.1/.p1 GENE.gb/GEZJ01006103.1/~~gb/GEZJ01006103.1/.p1  ORF type:complete len:221 (-),score=21.42 gb/GEZJ01006103.1/:97-759(-)